MRASSSSRLSRSRAMQRAGVPAGQGLAGRTLLSVARQRRGFDPGRCQLVLAGLDSVRAVQAALERVLAGEGLTDLRFRLLVMLFALDPEPVMPADLAANAEVSATAVNAALSALARRRLVVLSPSRTEPRGRRVRLTPAGRNLTERVIVRYLDTAGALARDITGPAQRSLFQALGRLQAAAQQDLSN